MSFLDIIATPYFMMMGVAGFFIIIGVGCLIVLTLLIFALIERNSKKKSDHKDTDEKDPQQT